MHYSTYCILVPRLGTAGMGLKSIPHHTAAATTSLHSFPDFFFPPPPPFPYTGEMSTMPRNTLFLGFVYTTGTLLVHYVTKTCDIGYMTVCSNFKDGLGRLKTKIRRGFLRGICLGYVLGMILSLGVLPFKKYEKVNFHESNITWLSNIQ